MKTEKKWLNLYIIAGLIKLTIFYIAGSMAMRPAIIIVHHSICVIIVQTVLLIFSARLSTERGVCQYTPTGNGWPGSIMKMAPRVFACCRVILGSGYLIYLNGSIILGSSHLICLKFYNILGSSHLICLDFYLIFLNGSIILGSGYLICLKFYNILGFIYLILEKISLIYLDFKPMPGKFSLL